MAKIGKPPAVPLPLTVRAAIALWLVVSVLLLVAAGSFAVSSAVQQMDRTGLFGLAGLLAALAVFQLFLVLRLRRGHRSARELLTTVAIIVGIPILVRGVPGLSVVTVVMLLSAGLLWLPQSNAYFQLTEPRERKRFRFPGTGR